MTQIIEMSEGRMGLFLYKISSFCWLRVSDQNKKVRIWHMVTFQKKAIAVGVVGLGLISVAADDNDSTTPERPPFTPPVTPTTTATTTTTGTTNTTTTTTTTTGT